MNDDPITHKKSQMRMQFRQMFKNVPVGRKIEASMRAALSLGDLLRPFSNVLSFANMDTEIDTQPLNALLAERGQLLLPRVNNSVLKIYAVKDLEIQLERSPWNILEPIPQLCQEILPEKIDFALIPAIAFDRNHYRLGRGKGYYDRLLQQISGCPAYGFGMKEQLFEGALPIADHDIALTGLYLF